MQMYFCFTFSCISVYRSQRQPPTVWKVERGSRAPRTLLYRRSGPPPENVLQNGCFRPLPETRMHHYVYLLTDMCV